MISLYSDGTRGWQRCVSHVLPLAAPLQSFGMTSRKYVFTLNNYTDEEEKTLHALPATEARVKGVGTGREVGESGTPHLQGVLYLNVPMRLSAVKQLPGFARAHLERMRGTNEEAEEYASKDGDYTFTGDRPVGQGRRTDLIALREDIDSGNGLRDIARDHFGLWLRHERGIRSYRELTLAPELPEPYPLSSFRWTEPENVRSLILWGMPGIGKTEFAKSLLPGALFVSHIDDLRNFDAGEHNGIIFDDMSFFHLPRSAQIHILDWDNPRSIHIRYSVARIPAHTQKIFTTNLFGGLIFSLEDGAIARRVTIQHCD